MSSVQATTGTGTVTFTFQVTNTTTEPIELEFADGQSFEFLVMRDGSEVWRWSDGQAFTQAERVMVLPAGETVRYQAVWNAPTAASGEYVVIAALTSRDGGVRQGATFRLP